MTKSGSSTQIDLFIIGAQKCGTTALHSFLSDHPDIFMPVHKELHLFDSDEAEGATLATNHRLNSEYIGAREDQLLGEATPSYLFWPGALERLKLHNPEARLLVVLRNPIERTYSQYVMQVRWGNESFSFSEAIRCEKERVVLNKGRATEFSPRRHSYVSRGFYCKQLERCFEHFKKEQVFVVLTEDLKGNHELVLRSIYDFLGVPSNVLPPEQTMLTAPYGAMAKEDWSYLESVFSEDINRLEDLLGRNLDCWRQQKWPGNGKVSDPEDSKGIVVLGMHRSGTSAFTRLLNILGCELGTKLMPPAKFNELGFWENLSITSIHEKLLDDCRRNWATCRPMDKSWNESDLAVDCRRKLANFIRVELSFNSLWAMKDPRTCRLLPMWLEIFEEASLDICFMLPFRHPDEVADSLEKRDGMVNSLSYLLWAVHNLEAERFTRGQKRTFVNYSACLADWQCEMSRVGVQLAIEWPTPWDVASEKIDDFLNPSLQHHRSVENRAPEQYVQIFSAFSMLCDNPNSIEACQVLDKVHEDLFSDDGGFRIETQKILDAAYDSSFQKFQHSSAALNNLNAVLQAEIAASNISNTDLQAEIAASNISNTDLQAEIAASHISNADLQAEITVSHESNAVLQKENSQLQELNSEFEKRFATIGGRIGHCITVFRSKVAPSGSIRNRVLKSLIGLFRTT